ncbi:MAG: hypothetical protein OXF02_07275 [Simkaniaceae bacterium]|nr:hypothetical protein [Simkaniaceae bacterium]
MASAVGTGQGIVWPTNTEKGTTKWLDKVPGEPPLRFNPLPEGKRRRYTKAEQEALTDYAVEVRETKSLEVCAGECNASATGLSRWVRGECMTYREMAHVGLDDHTRKTTDFRALLADLRAGTGHRPIHLPDYSIKTKLSTKQKGTKRWVRAQERTHEGHPYFLSVGKDERRTFTEEQKQRAVDYYFDEFEGESIKKCARICNLCSKTLNDWIDETQQCHSSRELSRCLPEALGGEDAMALAIGEGQGTAIWLNRSMGGPPLRFDPLPEGRQRRFTEEERCEIVDYALEMREVKSFKDCAEEIGISTATISAQIRTECETYPIFSALDVDDRTLRAIDYRALLVDLRIGKDPILISDYTGTDKYSDRNGLPGPGLTIAGAKEETRNGHPYFVPMGRGVRRTFTEEQKQRTVDCWLRERGGGSLPEYAGKCGIGGQTLANWVKRYGDSRGQRRSDRTELPGSSPKGTASDPVEDPLFDIPWWEMEGLFGTTPVEP